MSYGDDYPETDRLVRRQTKGRMELLSGIVRQVRPTTYAIFFGEMELLPSYAQPREKWVFLPKRFVERECEADAITGKAETLHVQEWLAKDRGLI